MADEFSVSETCDVLSRQLNSFWNTVLPDNIEELVSDTISQVKSSWDESSRIYYKKRGFSVLNTSVYATFLYYLAHRIGTIGGTQLADKLYYLNKILNSVEWYWNIELPQHFIVEHPIGSVLGKARYGNYFSIYQGVTVGERLSKDIVEWPTLGHHVIGNWVIMSAYSRVINEDIPDSCIVFGQSPSLTIKQYSREEIEKYFVKSWSADSLKSQGNI